MPAMKKKQPKESDAEVMREATALAQAPHRTGDLLGVIQQAVINKADVETMRELLGMRREERADQAREAYAQALVQFRAQCPTIKQTAERNDGPGRTRYKYAVLPQAVEQIQPLMTECGLAATWSTPQQSPQWIEVACTVTHVLGHAETTKLGGPPDTSGSKNQLQAIKSTWTYLRRVTLFSLLGLVDKDELDDDGTGGAAGTSKPKGQEDIEQGETSLRAKQEFVNVCRSKAVDPGMKMAAIKQVFETIANRFGSDDPQACLEILQDKDVSVGRNGTFAMKGDGPTGPDWDEPNPDEY